MSSSNNTLLISIKGDAGGAKKAFSESSQAANQWKKDLDGVKGSLGNIGGSLQGLSGLNINVSQVTQAFQGLSSAMAAGPIGLAVAGASLATKAIEGTITATIQWTQALMSQAKQLRQTSSELGITAERLQAFQRMAGKAGIDPEKATQGLEKLNVLLGEFRRGSEEATGKLKALGITAQQAAGMGTADLYDAVADKIKGTASASERAAIASDLLGHKLGPEMSRMLSQGKEGLDATTNKMRDMGQLMSSGEMLKLNDLKKSFSEIKDNFGNAFREVLVALTPAIKTIAHEIAEIVRWVAQLIEKSKDGLRMLGMMKSKEAEKKEGEEDFLKSASLEQKIDYFSGKIQELKHKAGTVGIGADDKADFKDAQKQLAELRNTQKQGWVGNQEKSAQAAVKAAKEEAYWAGKTKEAHEAAKMHDLATTTGSGKIEGLARELEIMDRRKIAQAETKKYWEEERRHYEELASKAKSLTESLNPAEKFREQFKELKEMLNNGLITSRQMSQALAKDKQSILQGLHSQAPSSLVGATEAGSSGFAEVARLMEDEAKQAWAEKQLQKLTEQLQVGKSSDDSLKQIATILTSNKQVTLTL